MDPETLNVMNESIMRALLWACELIAVIVSLFALFGFAIYLGGCARLCWGERQQPARRRTAPARSQPAESGWPVWRTERVDAETQLSRKKILLG
jgi:hypothetical protein